MAHPPVAVAASPASGPAIVVEGARTHNLQNVSVRIPRARMTVITGVSGSGKSSLAFDTLYAEGQRRYVESLSTYARQFLERMPRPDVDIISGLPPAIAIEQRNGVRNARSTVGTATEVSDFLRLLFAAAGEVHCPGCGTRVSRDTATAAAEHLTAGPQAGQRAHVVAAAPGGPNGLAELRRAGHQRLFISGALVRLDELGTEQLLDLAERTTLPVVLDRLRLGPSERGRLAAAIEAAFALGGGRAEIHVEGQAEPLLFDEGHRCVRCGRALEALTPARFSYNSPLGACATCQGFGRVVGIDWDKVIPDSRKSLAEGAIAPFQTPSNRECQDDLERACRRERIRVDAPWAELTEAEREFVVEGEGEGAWRRGGWYGVNGFFRWLESKKYRMHVRILLARYRGYTPCHECRGTRLRAEARAVLVGGRTIAELEALPVAELSEFVARLELGRQARATAEPVLREIESRLAYLCEVGLGYLSLIRQTRTLSGGEAQRIALAAALGARLTGTLYVLDEPSVGLHPRDSERLLGVLGRLVERGNTVVLVEHDPDIIRAADHIIDLGPGAGAAGGRVVFQGSFPELLGDRVARVSQTGALYRRRHLTEPVPLGVPPGQLRIVGARAHNLKDITVEIPLGRLVAVTGVSGSGKSSLVENVLYGNFMRQLGRACDDVGECERIEGLEALADVVLVDQTPLGRSSRSNPATYLKAFDEIRKLLAATPEAERLGLGPGAFSFNVARDAGGGRCEVCAGQGAVTLEMHFLADITVPCEACDGRRFGDKVLGVRLHGYNVTEILELTVDQALETFADSPRIQAALGPFAAVGLGYLKLGQSTATLSGGESQRLKLAAHLSERSERAESGRAGRSAAAGRAGRAAEAGRAGRGRSRPKLFLLDEPTTGLHAADVELLLAALARLRAAGHTIVVVEHNLDFIRQSDHLIDLGPEGGEAGGRVVAVGSPIEVARVPHSHTGRALARLFTESATPPTSPTSRAGGRPERARS
ncbi:MAG TPA: excinuclease ABC subunit UvrA [Polyangia bacterium]|nr:excinuclease ABC subunit UvrA [Polyangia bacterium]